MFASLLLAGAVAQAAAVAAQEKAPASKSDHQPLGIGKTPDKALIEAWNIDIAPDGANLPEGSGSVAQGKGIFEARCVACHGEHGTEGPMDRLAGGKGTLDTDKPVKTVGSYWPYATTLYDYIHRAMPFDAPQSLSPDEVYAVSAYVLNLNGILPDDAVLDRKSLPKIKMPNRDGFERTDTVTKAGSKSCMADCKPLLAGEGATKTKPITQEQVQ
jgi:cytochrome c